MTGAEGDQIDVFEQRDLKKSPDTLVVDVAGFEGPLDLLLSLARDQKVDMSRISILELVEQYLAFIADARRLKLEIAADYLVMAAWLAYLKSRLLIPDSDADEEPTGAELAAALAFRLKRLEAMREASKALFSQKLLGRDVFQRGMPEPIVIRRRSEWDAKLYDLLEAYAAQRERSFVRFVKIGHRRVISLKEAREQLLRVIGDAVDWTSIDMLLTHFPGNAEIPTSARAGAFCASLELVREGELELQQADAFAPLFVRRRFRSTQAMEPRDEF